MNSFDEERDISLLKSVSPVSGREPAGDNLLQTAFDKVEAAEAGKSDRSQAAGKFGFNPSRLKTRFTLQGLAIAASVSVVALVGATLVAGNLQNKNQYLFSTGGAQGTTKMNAGGDALGAKSAVASMALAMPAFSLNYVAGPGLSTQSGSGNIFQIISDGDPKAIALALADYFGIEGGITRQENEGIDWVQYVPTRELQQPQDTALNQVVTPQSMYVSTSGEYLSFGYNDNNAYNWSSCQMQMDPVPDYCSGIKEEQLPSLTEAQTQAGQILSRLGVKWGSTIASTPSGGYVLDTSYQEQQFGMVAAYATTGSATESSGGTIGAPAPKTAKSILVTASLVVAGKATPIQIQFSWLPGYAKIASLYGELAKAIDRGSFDTISAHDSVARLNQYGYGGQVNLDWNNLKWSTKTYQDMPETMRQKIWACSSLGNPSDVAIEGAVDGSAPAPEPVASPSDSPTAKCDLPVENGIPQIDAAVTRAETAQVMIWDSNGGRWLVPGFNFYDDTGYLASAFSVVDGIIKIDAPSMQPMTK